MSADAEVVLGAEIAGLQAGMQQAAQAVQTSIDEMKGHFEGLSNSGWIDATGAGV